MIAQTKNATTSTVPRMRPNRSLPLSPGSCSHGHLSCGDLLSLMRGPIDMPPMVAHPPSAYKGEPCGVAAVLDAAR